MTIWEKLLCHIPSPAAGRLRSHWWYFQYSWKKLKRKNKKCRMVHLFWYLFGWTGCRQIEDQKMERPSIWTISRTVFTLFPRWALIAGNTNGRLRYIESIDIQYIVTSSNRFDVDWPRCPSRCWSAWPRRLAETLRWWLSSSTDKVRPWSSSGQIIGISILMRIGNQHPIRQTW